MAGVGFDRTRLKVVADPALVDPKTLLPKSLKAPTADENYAPAHSIDIVEGGLLHELLGERRVMVNSLHAQGVDALAPRARLEAIADDGQVEAFSVPEARYSAPLKVLPVPVVKLCSPWSTSPRNEVVML